MHDGWKYYGHAGVFDAAIYKHAQIKKMMIHACRTSGWLRQHPHCSFRIQHIIASTEVTISFLVKFRVALCFL